MAVDLVKESAFGMLDERVAEGRYLESEARLAAYVGAEMVESLELRLGSRFVVQAQDAEGRAPPFRVRPPRPRAESAARSRIA